MRNIKNWVQPIGYTGPFVPKELPGKSLSQQEREAELTYLISTQHLDLAPMWAELAANGIPAFSKDSPVETEEGDVEVGDVPAETPESLALAQIIDGGRAEAFARERDYQTWNTTLPRRALAIERDGRRGIVPKPGSIFATEELQAMLARKPKRRVDEGEVGFWLDSLGLSEDRSEFEAEDQLARYERDRLGYASGEPCPETRQQRADGTPLCQNGIVPITIDGEVAYYEECPTCNGDASVMGILGTTLDITDSE
jgi:hypothetical protein